MQSLFIVKTFHNIQYTSSLAQLWPLTFTKKYMQNIWSASFSLVTIHACDGRTDRQTDRITTSKNALAYARAVKTYYKPIIMSNLSHVCYTQYNATQSLCHFPFRPAAYITGRTQYRLIGLLRLQLQAIPCENYNKAYARLLNLLLTSDVRL